MIYLMKVKRFLQGFVNMNDVRRLKKKQDGAMSSEMMGGIDDEEQAGMPWCAGRGALVQEDEKVCRG